MDPNNPAQNLQKNINLEVSKRVRKIRKVREMKLIETNKFDNSFFNGSGVLVTDDTKQFMGVKIDIKKEDRPIVVFPDGHIFLETFSPHAKIAKEFVELIALPVSLPVQILEYQINTNSLNQAIQNGLTSQEIVRVLSLLSKCKIEDALIELITKTCTSFSSSLNLLFSNNSYIVYSDNTVLLRHAYRNLLPFVNIKQNSNCDDNDDFYLFDNFEILKAKTFGPLHQDTKECDAIITPEIAEEVFKNTNNNLFYFEIINDKIDEMKAEAINKEIQLTNEYDFKSDANLDNIDISNRSLTEIQLYQYQSDVMVSLFQNSYLRNGIITLPYGTGKSVIGVLTVGLIKKSTLIFCENILSIQQWFSSFLKFTTIDDLDIIKFLPESKDEIPKEPCVILTTYSYFLAQKSSDDIQKISERMWGLVIFDELKNELFDAVDLICTKIKSRSRLGLNPIPMIDDKNIRSLNLIIGPQLYCKTWHELSEQGFVPKVQCNIVYCKMTRPFYREYLQMQKLLLKRLISGLNPNKIMALERLIRMHEDRGDKIIVYADILYILNQCADRLFLDGRKRRPIITTKTPQDEIENHFYRFRHTKEVSCLFMSRIVDKAIEIPPANVLIQICSHLGSKIPESQRFGRILKAKSGRSSDAIHNAYFYTLVSDDTKEVFYSNRNRQLLIEQGFDVKPIFKYKKHSSIKQKLCVQSPEAQIQLFNEIITTDQNNGIFEVLEEEKMSLLMAPIQHISKNLPSVASVVKRSDYNKYKFYSRK